ncbi:hypothetical protein [Alkalibacterium pelagium]|nr:hypothetical protein [Alkalibacterium pelagium]GEN51239.1 hypothetical protein APE02nite_19040 [Alkalibacterium pelagium]
MKQLKQLFWILLFSFIGEFLSLKSGRDSGECDGDGPLVYCLALQVAET